MTAPNSLQVTCKTCKVAQTCPRRGGSPLYLEGGKKMVTCRVVGGYGRTPVDPSSLSEESKARAEKDGPCLTIADVPTVDPHTGKLYLETVKVFHHPITHPREKTPYKMDSYAQQSHSIQRPRRS